MTNLPVDEEAIFKVACEIASAEARTVYLRQVCSDDQTLFDRVAALLKVRDEEPSFLESPPSELAATMEPSDVREQPGEQIGPYKLLQIIGEGGMGVVYMAEQTHPVKRRVALKIIKPGMDSRQVIARFEAERQALAMMDHPNIAKVYDAGTVEAGRGRRGTAGTPAEQTPSASSLSPPASSLRPYFVMELVRGVPITEYCDQHELTPRERLALFADVCHAVQHAHQKGVIHRDIKPSNVLVADYDDKPVPKIIDFGLAKAVSFSLTDMTNFTRLGQVVGTFEYMSPEQAKLNQLDVDTRTDVYSLGVLLYELLTGSTPFDRERLRSAALDELLRIIRDEDPPKPSTRISSLGETAASLSAKRKTDPQRLLKQVRGDLDWIVMKALEKDRARRYETAAELAADAERYLNDEHVLASPPSKLYRLKRTMRRHRGPVVAAGLLLLSLLVGIAGTTWGLVNVRRERDVAEERLARLREELESMAVMHAMNGNVEHMRQSVNDAMEAGATKGWAKSVEAIPAIFSGEWENSIMLLEGARQEGEDTLAVHGMLGLVRAAQGDADEFIHEFEVLRNRLKDGAPRRFQDKVFCAMFLTYAEPHDAYQWANDAFDEYRSPVALAVRSTTRTLLACTELDIDQAEQAIAEASAAAVFMPDSPFLLSSRLSSHLMALYLGRDTKDDNFIRRHREAGRELAERLEAFPHYAVGHRIAADFYEEIGDVAEARRRYQLHDSLGAFYSAFLLRHNEIDEATKVLSGIPLDGFFLDTHVIIAGDHEEMRTEIRDRLVTELRDQSLHNIHHLSNVSRLCLLGFGECATSEAERVISTQAEIDPVERELLLILAGKTTTNRLDRLTGHLSRPQCLVHYMAGCRLLGQRDREGALAEFAKCKPMIDSMHYDVARTILKRMEDPRWPRWMTDNAEVQTPPAKQTR